jgi:hypothetical protein
LTKRPSETALDEDSGEPRRIAATGERVADAKARPDSTATSIDQQAPRSAEPLRRRPGS